MHYIEINCLGVQQIRSGVPSTWPQNRLIAATLVASGNQNQAMTYDRYGNVTQILRNGVATAVPVQAASNHLSTPSVYDASGNLTYRLAAGQAQQLSYDSQNRVQTLQSPDVAKGLVYTADGERLLEIDFGDPWTVTWSVRDLSGKVLRQWQHVPSGNGGLGRWSWKKDYIYRDGQLLASNSPSDGVRHHHLDHLGSPRLITDENGVEVARHTYFPFGEEVTDPNQDSEPMKFTGHERDANGPGTADDLDYMHARYYSPGLCRFLSVDPASSAKLGVPQSWNKYTYVTNRPLVLVDPNGEEAALLFGLQTQDNVFGHVALAVNGRVFSQGTRWVNPQGDWGVPLDAYLAAQVERRETVILNLDITTEQESDLQDFLENTNPYESEYSVLENSCVTSCEDSLEATGILDNSPGPMTVDSAGNLLQAGSEDSLTPRSLVGQLERQGLVKDSTIVAGKKVSELRALIGTAISALTRFF